MYTCYKLGRYIRLKYQIKNYQLLFHTSHYYNAIKTDTILERN